MKWEVVSAQPNSDYTISLVFKDGKTGSFDMKPYLSKKCYQPLNNVSFFLLGTQAFDTVVWPGDIDIAPETLYEECV